MFFNVKLTLVVKVSQILKKKIIKIKTVETDGFNRVSLRMVSVRTFKMKQFLQLKKCYLTFISTVVHTEGHISTL